MSTANTFSVESSAEELAVGFARILRALDIPAPLDSVLTFMTSLSLVGMDNRESVYWAARTTLVRHPEHVTTFNRAFAVFWEHRESIASIDEEQMRVTLALDTDEQDGATDGEARGRRGHVAVSRH